MADLSCASKQITQTDMEYDDLVQVDASPEAVSYTHLTLPTIYSV